MAREMEAMKKMMVQAGLNPDLAVAASKAVQGAPVQVQVYDADIITNV